MVTTGPALKGVIMIDEQKITEEKIWKILETVTDPEVPVLSILDLGIVRSIEIDANKKIEEWKATKKDLHKLYCRRY